MNKNTQCIHLIEDLQALTNETVKNWRLGNDHIGLQSYILLLKEFKKIFNVSCIEISSKQKTLNHTLAMLKKMDWLLENQDVVGLTDLLEYSFSSFLHTLKKEVNPSYE